MNDAQFLALLMAVLGIRHPTMCAAELAAAASEMLNEAQHEARCRNRAGING